LTLIELRYIVTLSRERHFGRAAERCLVSQPTLSVAVKKLEERLGVVLFERGIGAVRMTPIGERIVAQAERVIEEAARLGEIAAAGKDPLSGSLRIGCIYTIGPYLLPKLVPLLRERAPQMPLYIAENYTANLLDLLKRGEVDIIVVALPALPAPHFAEPGIVAQPVYDEAFRVLLPTGHPWQQMKAVEPSSLLNEPLLMLGPGNCFRDQVLDLCAGSGDRSSGLQLLEGGSLETIRHMVAGGIGITVMPASAVDDIAGKDRLLQVRRFVEPTPTRRVGLAWRSSFPRYRAVDVLRQAMLDCHLAGTRAVRG
jgi:LysR family hydrogen peroxide-inducible transcriptional activator